MQTAQHTQLLHTSLIFLHILFIFLQNLDPKGRGRIQKGGLANSIFTPGVELGIFPSPSEAHDWWDFSTSILTTYTLLRYISGGGLANVLFTPGVELEIFLKLTEEYDGIFSTKFYDWSKFSKNNVEW